MHAGGSPSMRGPGVVARRRTQRSVERGPARGGPGRRHLPHRLRRTAPRCSRYQTRPAEPRQTQLSLTGIGVSSGYPCRRRFGCRGVWQPATAPAHLQAQPAYAIHERSCAAARWVGSDPSSARETRTHRRTRRVGALRSGWVQRRRLAMRELLEAETLFDRFDGPLVAKLADRYL